MADAHICDRCGKIIVATTNRQKIGIAAWKYSIFDRSHSYSTRFDCDLCSECADKILKFLNGYELVDISDRKEVE